MPIADNTTNKLNELANQIANFEMEEFRAELIIKDAEVAVASSDIQKQLDANKKSAQLQLIRVRRQLEVRRAEHAVLDKAVNAKTEEARRNENVLREGTKGAVFTLSHRFRHSSECSRSAGVPSAT